MTSVLPVPNLSVSASNFKSCFARNIWIMFQVGDLVNFLDPGRCATFEFIIRKQTVIRKKEGNREVSRHLKYKEGSYKSIILCTYRHFSDGISPSSLGIVPHKLLPLKSKSSNIVRPPISFGITPVKLFLQRML